MQRPLVSDRPHGRPRAAALALAAVAALTLVLAAGCGKRDDNMQPPPDERPGATAPVPAAAQGSMTDPTRASAAGEARKIFASRCATCHGPSGRGDGAAAQSMQPPPRNYADQAWQASVTDADLAHIIVAGGAAVGRSSMMPAGNDLKDRPEVVAELVKLIRSFAAP